MAKSARPTIYDVARLAGVSTATVSRSLNRTGQIAEATQRSIEEAIRQLGYSPNTLARSLVTKSTQTIALLLPDITNPFYAALMSGVQQRALDEGYTMLLCATGGEASREELYLSLLHSKQVDGALVDGLVLPADRIARFVGDGLPIVCLDRDLDSPDVPRVQVDNALGARMATEHLLQLGHTRIGHVAGATELTISRERTDGYREALSAAGLDPDPSLVHTGRFTEEGGYEAAQALLRLEVPPTAIFAANDLSAIGVLNAISESGRRVPGDVSVIGFDDLRLSAFTRPVAQLRHLLPPRLVVRGSTGPVPV